jgi:dipeptidase D
MSKTVRELEPKEMWNHFADINAVPRPSKKEERIIAYMVEFGNKLGLQTMQDEIGNVIIKKPASPGMEGRQTRWYCKVIWIWYTRKMQVLILILILKELKCL